jgi:glutathione S-transferase
MKFYDCRTAPSPRRVRIFMAEKAVEIPTVQVDLRNDEQFSAAYRAINPQCMVPYLVLDDGTGIGEAAAICRFLEMAYPDPPLLGATARDRGVVAMWDHRMEVEGFMAVAEAFRNSTPGLKGRAFAGPRGYEQIPALVERGKARVRAFLAELDRRLGDTEFIAGPHYTIADITALVSIDFAGRMKLAIPEDHAHLKRWHEAVSARPSAKA